MQDTISLLKECSLGCKMAIESIQKIRTYVVNEKLKDLLDGYEKKHQKLGQEAVQLLGEYGKQGEEPGAFAEFWAKMDIDMKMLVRDDNHQIAKLMMDGCNMGIQSLSENVNKYTQASEESKALAKKIIKAEEDFMAEMKQFM